MHTLNIYAIVSPGEGCEILHRDRGEPGHDGTTSRSSILLVEMHFSETPNDCPKPSCGAPSKVQLATSLFRCAAPGL